MKISNRISTPKMTIPLMRRIILLDVPKASLDYSNAFNVISSLSVV